VVNFRRRFIQINNIERNEMGKQHEARRKRKRRKRWIQRKKQEVKTKKTK
jgi:hypothetical protein